MAGPGPPPTFVGGGPVVPAIHVLLALKKERKTWMPGTRPGMTTEKPTQTNCKKL